MIGSLTPHNPGAWTHVVLALLLAVGPYRAVAADSELDRLEALFARVELLRESAQTMDDWQLDGFNLRIDQLGLDAVSQTHILARERLSNADTGSSERDALSLLLDRAAALALARIDYLEKRAAAERATFEKFQQGVESDIARAFIEDLTLIRLDYLELLVEQAQIRRAAGIDHGAQLIQARRQVVLALEPLTGQIRLDAMSLDGLRSRLSGDPHDENLRKAIALVQDKQYRSLDALQRVIDTAGSLNIDTAEQQALLLRERGQLGVELLQREVFASLWRDAFKQARDSIVRNGPNVLFRTLLFLLFLALAWVAARITRWALHALLQGQRISLGALRRDVLVSVSGAMVFVIGALIALALTGVSLGPLFAGIGVAGILVGLAVQDSLRNLAAGAMILVYRPYDVDDYVKTSSAEGLVKRMNLLATTIATFDNQSLIVPNGRIWGDTIINYSVNRVRRVDTEVGVAYSADPERVVSVLMELICELDYVLAKPEPAVHIVGMQESSVSVVVKPWVRTEDYWRARFDLPLQIKKQLDANGIEIPFPQRVVTIATPDRESFLPADREDSVPSAGE